MLKFFNETAIITYQPDTSIILVTFGDSENYDDYLETIQIAEGMAQVHGSVSYLIEKKDFNKLPIDRYGQFSTQWMGHLDAQSNARQSVAWLVPAFAFSPLSDYYHRQEVSASYPLVAYNVFTSPEAGIQFLRATE